MPSTGSPIPPLSRRIVKTRDQGRCLRCGCPTRNGEWHHRRSRRVRGEHRHCVCNGVWLCNTCHRDVHSHPTESLESGFIVSGFIDLPGSIPIQAHYGIVLLDCHGFFNYYVEDKADEF